MTDLVKTDVSTQGAFAQLEETHDAPGHEVHHHAEPSVVPDPAWGWVGESPKAFKIAGVIIAGMLLVMIIGNHTGRTEDLYLIGFAVFILLIIAKDALLNRWSLRKK